MDNTALSIYQYSNMARGFQEKKLLYVVLCSSYSSLFWELSDKRNLKKMQFYPKASETCYNIDISNAAKNNNSNNKINDYNNNSDNDNNKNIISLFIVLNRN